MRSEGANNNDNLFVLVKSQISKSDVVVYSLKLGGLGCKEASKEAVAVTGTDVYRFKNQLLLASTFKTLDKCYDYNYFE